MEKLLNALASNLNVRVEKLEHYGGDLNITTKMFDYKPADNQTREAFKVKLKEHLIAKLGELNRVGDFVDYSFNHGVIRPMSALMEDANDNLAEVLLELPALKEGEHYVLPKDTFVRFKLLQKESNYGNMMVTVEVCNWIISYYCHQ